MKKSILFNSNSRPVFLAWSLTALFVLLSLFSAKAQSSPDRWNYIGGYKGSMTFMGLLLLDGEEVMTGDYEVAAFSGDQLRGAYRLGTGTSLPEHPLMIMMVIGSNNDGEIITFKAYNHDTQTEFDLNYSVAFEDGATLGMDYSQGTPLFDPVMVTGSDPSASKYSVIISPSSNGSVSADQTTVAAGKTVTLTSTPNAGYELDVLTVSGGVTLGGSGDTRTFTMPASDVTVTATFKKTQATLDAEAVAEAKALIEAETFTVPQATANTQADVKSWLAAQINALSGMSETGITVSAADITVSGFTAASGGTNGSFTFTVALSKGVANGNAGNSGTITATPPVLTVSPASLTFAAAGGETKTVTVTSNVNWTASSDKSWLHVTSGSGNGDGSIALSADPNTGGSRTATVTVTGDGVAPQSISVTQEAYVPAFVPVDNIALSPTTVTIGTTTTLAGTVSPADATNQTIVWNIENDGGTGATVTPEGLFSSSKAGVVTIRATVTDGKAAGTDYTQDFTVTVNPPDFIPVTNISGVPATVTLGVILLREVFINNVLTTSSLNMGSIVIDPSGATNQNIIWSIKDAGTTGLSITSETSFAYVNGQLSAITTTTTIPTAPGTLILTATIKDGVATGTDYVQDFTVTVTDATFSVSPSSLNFAAAGGQQTVTVTSDMSANWNIHSDASWLTVSPASGNKNGTVTLTAAANTGTASRTATVTVKSGYEIYTRTVTVTQDAYVPPATTLTVSASAIDFLADSGTETFTVSSNTSWTVGSDAAWVSVSPASGSNDGTITVTVAANTTNISRTATVTVSGGGITRNVTIRQKAPAPPATTLTVSPTSLDFAAAGGTETFTVSSNTSWTVGSSATWLSVSPASGSNDGTVTLTASANTSTASRTATVTVSGGGITRTVSVTQDAYVPPATTLTVSPASLDFAAAGGSKTFTVSSNTSWTVTAPNNSKQWLSISPASGSNDGTVTLTVAENKSAAQRSTTVTVSGGGITRTITVTQEPKDTSIIPNGKDPKENNGNGKKQGNIEINLSVPSNATLTGSLEVVFPEGMTLDEQLTALSFELSGNFKLVLTYLGNNTWNIAIESNGLKSGTEAELLHVMTIAYTVDDNVSEGDYEISLQNISFLMNDGTVIAEDELTVPVHVSNTVANDRVQESRFFAVRINSTLHIESAHRELIRIYSISGSLLWSGQKNEGALDVPAGSFPGSVWVVSGSVSGSLKVAR
jgi:hypothetical protein